MSRPNIAPRALLRLALALPVAVAPSLAHAEAPPPATAIAEAKVQFAIGAQAYSNGKFEIAVRSFEEAYRLVSRPEILFSLAQAERKHCAGTKDPALLQRALGHFRAYYAMPNTPRKSDAIEAISDLQRMAVEFGGQGAPVAPAASITTLSVGTQDSSRAVGARVYVDGRSQGELPFVGPVSPGKHHIEVRLDGYLPSTADVLVPLGGKESLLLKLVERPVGVAFDAPPGTDVHVDGAFAGRTPLPVAGVPLSSGVHTAVLVKNGRRLAAKDFTVEKGKPMLVRAPLEVSTQRVAAYVIGGAGLASLAASGAFYGVALGEQSRAQNREAQRLDGKLQPAGLEQYNAAIGNRDTFRVAGTAAALGGVTALTAGVLLFVFDKPDPNSVPLRGPEGPKRKPGADFELGFAPLLSPGTAGAGAFGRF